MSELTSSTSKKRILVVDDDPVILKALSIKLKAHGYDVLTASDGSTAVTTVRTMKPDLIVLDISFPPDFGNVDWDGFRILEWLKRLDEIASTPIVMVTGGSLAKSSGDPSSYETRAKQSGAAAFFRKPLNHEQFFETIGQLMTQAAIAA